MQACHPRHVSEELFRRTGQLAQPNQDNVFSKRAALTDNDLYQYHKPPPCLAYIVANVFLRRGPGGRPSKPAGEEALQAASKKKSSKRQAPFVRLWLPYA